jgi:pimeloyl-ACP methyl ester carboxylesterase
MLSVKSHLSLITPTPQKPNRPLFIFLPGMDGTGLLYQKQAERLAKFFNVRCLAISPEDTSDWDSLAVGAIDLIKKEITQEGKQEESSLTPLSHSPSTPHPIYLCGESFGGCLALKITLEMPELFDRLILVNPASSFNERIWLGWGVNITQWIPDFLHQGSTLALLPFLAALQRIAPKERRTLLDAMNSVPPRVASWRLSLLRDFMVESEDLHRITQPTLILAGGQDRLLPSTDEAKRLITHLPKAQVVSLPNSGHACLLENDVYLDEIMQENDFLKTNILLHSDRA